MTLILLFINQIIYYLLIKLFLYQIKVSAFSLRSILVLFVTSKYEVIYF